MKLTKLIVDVSKWQGIMDWPKCEAAGAKGAYIKATDGLAVDPRFAANWAGAELMPRGAYHFYRPELSASGQVKTFLQILDGDWGEMPPALDVERVNATVAVLRAGIRLWLQEIEKATGLRPRIYTRASLWDPALGNWSVARQHELWVADYRGYITPDIPLPWHEWTMYQFSADKNGRGHEFGAQSSDIDLSWLRAEI